MTHCARNPVTMFQMFLVLLNVLSETSYFEGPGAKHVMFTMGDDFTYQVLLELLDETTKEIFSSIITHCVCAQLLDRAEN